MSVGSWRRAALAAALAAFSLAASARASAIDLLHVEANEGGSSGGHLGLRFGEAVYHFQNQAGRLRLVRDDAERFVEGYALLENRPIHGSRIEVSPAWEARLRERFERRLDAQRSQEAGLEALRAERALLALLLRRARREPGAEREGLALPAAGYFELSEAGAAGAPDPALAALHARVVRERGAGFFARRRGELAEALAALAPDLGPAVAPRLAAEVPLPPASGFGARYADLAAGSLALEILEHARPLRADALPADDSDALALTQGDERALELFSAGLSRSLARLAGVAHGDEGGALLLGLARLAAVQTSLREGRLRVLDGYAESAERFAPADLVRASDVLPKVVAESAARVAAARERFAASGASQPAWSDLEDAAGRYLELRRAVQAGQGLRVQRERLVPARPADLLALPPPAASPDVLARALGLARERERAFEAEMRRLHRYQLVGHNCVSDIFATLDAAFADPARDSREALGGWVDPTGPAAIIPFVAAEAAAQRYRVSERFAIPSLRQRRLARMREREGGLRVALREASPLTAHAYERGARDSFFLFFTDGAVLTRPLLGAFNTAAAAGETALGLLRAPWDGGRMLLRGLQGTAMSLPELAFVSLRKGTNDWVPAEEVRLLGAQQGRPAFRP